ncbi:heat shock 22 kDa protein, mitochondrial-like [Actinidia eriantha]|uniref:heat shock 22 kDa protein, mitochondrial-like n=1 Tax=Actinidia eriantha TaxID=165200 RepID=UPI00258DF141|nr:heat shock 22 kDa protein, mitochondrial-like [Actinidia eriantha]
MALLMALRRGPLLSTKFLRRNPNPAATVASLLSRGLSSGIPIMDSDNDTCTINSYGGAFSRSDHFPIRRGTCDQYMDNPFQVSGPRGSYEAKKVEKGLFVRMEMPGIEKEDVKIWVEDDNVFVKGEGKKESKHEDSGRTYSAGIELCSDSFQLENIRAEMKNGVLRLLIPNAKSFEATRGLCEVKCS